MKHTPKPEILRPDGFYVLDGKLYKVGLINFSRARLDPLFRIKRIIVSRLHDYTRIIHTTPNSINVSPEAYLTPAFVPVKKNQNRKG